MTNKEIGKVLKNTADMIDLTGGNPFRARSMANAARTLSRLDSSVVELTQAGQLTTIRGVGDGLAAQVAELIETGSFEVRENLIGAIPAGVLDMMRIKGLGAKKVRTLWQTMGITTVEELEHAANAGLIATQEGFGAKTQDNILKNLQLLKQYMTRRRYADVVTFAQPILEALLAHEGISNASFSGELRRKLETIETIEFVVVAEDITSVEAVLSTWLDPQAEKSQTPEGCDYTAQLANGLSCCVYLATSENFGSILWQRTGSKSHIDMLVAHLDASASYPDESALFDTAGIPIIPPELREGDGELEAAKANSLPALIEYGDIHGTLHNHSTYSDGAHTLSKMAETAREMGLSYFGICDHSRSLVIANGLSIEEVARQQEEISTLNAAFAADGGAPFKIFSGIESDILGDGSLDYPDEVLATFDLVVASVHTRLNMSADEATERVLKAVKNPYTTILGHPTGRILLVREGYPLHYEKVLDACAEAGVAIELNASPYRLDLDWRWLRAATERGILISINPDAHSIDGLKDMAWGVEAARKGWLTADHCLNAKSLEEFSTWLEHRRSS